MSDKRPHDHAFDPRFAAFWILEDVLVRDQPLDQAEPARIDDRADPRDRAFCRHLVYACLRHQGELRKLTKKYLRQTPTGRGRSVATIVQLGLAQILFTDVPPYAAADKTVELCRKARLGGFTKLVNAIMRRAVDDAPAAMAKLDADYLNTPGWLRETWTQAFGDAGARAITAAHQIEPPLDIVIKDVATTEQWAPDLGGQIIRPGVIRTRSSGGIQALNGFDAGAWWVQDVAATLPVEMLGDVSGQRIADLCAAPGGKTLQLAARGAEVTAIDRSANRLKRLRDNLKRTGLKAAVETTDATTWTPAAPFDAVLLDAPCSATGTIRRHPDIPWLRSPDDIEKLGKLQARLLRHAIDLVKPGGLIVYCTCSLQPEEGERQIEALLASGVPVERVPLSEAEAVALISGEQIVTKSGDLRTLPSMMDADGGMDGFFAARLKRVS